MQYSFYKDFLFTFQSLSLVLIIYNIKNGLRTSGLLFTFWLLCAICGIPQLRTEIRQAEEREPSPFFPYVSYLIYYPLVIIILFLNCWADKPPKTSFYLKKQVSSSDFFLNAK